jgi:site-specific DNA-methyltransferase (adenine-specific)
MNKCNLILGDCLVEMPKIADKSIDMILCDLPYNTTACEWDKLIPFEPLWEQYKRIIKDNGAIVLTASQPFTSALVMSNIKMFKYEFIWEKSRKTGFANCKKIPLKAHENICVFYKHLPKYNPQSLVSCNINQTRKASRKGGFFITEDAGRKSIQTIGNYPTSIIKIKSEHNKNAHPTQKPVALFEYLIKTYTNEGDLVLDNCMGSGTSGVACKNLNRDFIGIEKDPKYFEIAQKRISETPEKLL